MMNKPLRYYKERGLELIHEEGLAALINRFKRKLYFCLIPTKYSYKFHTTKNYIINQFRYKNPPLIYKILYIDSTKINVRNKSISINFGLGQIKDGDWDVVTNTRLISEEWFIIGLRQRFKQEKEWKNTLYYKTSKRRLNNGKNVPGVDNMNQLENRLKYLDELFNDMKYNGYKRAIHTRRNHKHDFKDNLEVLVYITRDGVIQHYDGIHRLAMAQILGLKIPVQVVCRHKSWQKLRDNIYTNGLSEDRKHLRDHPDLQDILNS